MPNGYGFRGGCGFGFRGSSPPWPYIGRGRGGLPRCGYFWSGAAGMPMAPPYSQAMPAESTPYPSYGRAWQAQFYSAPHIGTMPGATSAVPQMTPEQELGFLRDEAQAINSQLKQIEARMRELENDK